jgi:ABC-type polysaccharide/polyol phosphate transport system ATPase subunit
MTESTARESSAVIELRGVSKSFPRHRGHRLLRDHVRTLLGRSVRERFCALHNVSLQIRRGESVAIVGANGAGKSTLLGIIGRLAKPDSGSVAVRGRVAALLELGLGFQPDLTGRENIRLNASLLGLSRKETKAQSERIVEFSGIRDFIEEPLRTYSSGMIMRLGFSVAMHVDPDIILIDEVMAVGDAAFSAKCFEKLRDFQAKGAALVCVSHSPSTLRELCHTAVLLDHGEMLMTGAVGEVLDAYARLADTISVKDAISVK